MSINYEHKTHVNSDIEETFAWHERKGSFRRLMPPWEVAEEVRADDTLEDGAQRIFKFPMGPVKMKWIARHSASKQDPGSRPGVSVSLIALMSLFNRIDPAPILKVSSESAEPSVKA